MMTNTGYPKELDKFYEQLRVYCGDILADTFITRKIYQYGQSDESAYIEKLRTDLYLYFRIFLDDEEIDGLMKTLEGEG